MYRIHFICFGFFLKVRAITQDLLQTSVNERGEEGGEVFFTVYVA